MESSKNFKRLSDVEVVETPAETANVLIEENGIIKKAPKTAVGGAGGSVEPDMIISITNKAYISNASNYSPDDFEISFGDTTTVIDKLKNGKPVNIFLIGGCLMGSGCNMVLSCSAQHVSYTVDYQSIQCFFMFNPFSGNYVGNDIVYRLGINVDYSNSISEISFATISFKLLP